jgi:glycosyltransferase involved in cell wall biosynthesis
MLPSYLRPIDEVLTSPSTTVKSLTQIAQNINTIATASPTQKLRFMLVSTHTQQYTGYSKVSYGILKELAKCPFLDLYHFGFQRHPQVSPEFRPYPPNVEVIDAASLEKPIQQGFGYQGFLEVVKKKNPHVIMIYNDMAVVTHFLEEIRKTATPRPFKVWIYCDQVYTNQNQIMIDILNRDSDRVFTFTQFWKKQLKEQGITRPLSVLGHGIDPRLFFSVPREMARKSLKLPDDTFVIMSLNRNQPRKRYDIMIMAFAELLGKNPEKNVVLLCICDKGEKGGWPLFELYIRELKKLGLPIEKYGNRLMVSSQDMAFRDEDINLLYNVADIGISTAEGEGWGLCTFEQMAVGIPQIVPDLGGYKEYCSKENSILVKPAFRYYLPAIYSPVGGEAHVCDPHDVCLAMDTYLNNSEKRGQHGQKAKEKVLTYTWETATKDLISHLQQEHLDL